MGIKAIISYKLKCFLTKLSPKLNTKVLYWSKFGRRLNLNNPQTLNEKTLWLKFNTYWKNSLVKQCADKYRVREYVSNCGCGDCLNNLIGAYNTPEQIEWDSLPKSFALKLNIGCGRNYIVVDKQKEDSAILVTMMRKWLEEAPNLYLPYSEMQYKDVDPVILVEEYLGGPNGELPEDYKFYCINGKCYMTMFCKDRDNHGHGAKYYYMDRDWNMITNGVGEHNMPVEKPVCLDRAMVLAEKLCQPFPFVRVDLYLLGERIVFGELTFTPAAGMDVDHKLKPFDSEEDLDHIYGRILKLPEK